MMNKTTAFHLLLLASLSACTASPVDSTPERTGQITSRVGTFPNDDAVCQYFVGKGLTDFQAAGIVGNLDQESGASPTAQQSGGPGMGIAQWSQGGRWDTDGNDNAVWYAGTKGADVWSLQLQLDFIWYELTTFSGYGLGALQGSTNVTDATVAFETDFEGCGQCDESQRIAYAQAELAGGGCTPPPPPDATPRGWVDSADCTAISGWSQDTDAPDQPINVDIYFDGQAGSGAQGVRTLAGNYRADLCTAIGSCSHGYSLGTPRGLMDGAQHSVYPYGIDAAGSGNNPLLQGAPKSFTCAPPALPFTPAIKRHVTDPTSFSAWQFSYLLDVAHLPDAQVGALANGPDTPAAPVLEQADDGTPEVWLVDGPTRRHIVNPDSMTAWRFSSSSVKKTPAAQVYALPKGLDWPATPFLVMGSGAAVYVLDYAPAQSSTGDAGASGAGDGGSTGHGGAGPDAGAPPGSSLDGGAQDDGGWASSDGASGGSSGCSMGGPSRAGPYGVGALLLWGLVVSRRRRASTRSTT